MRFFVFQCFSTPAKFTVVSVNFTFRAHFLQFFGQPLVADPSIFFGEIVADSRPNGGPFPATLGNPLQLLLVGGQASITRPHRHEEKQVSARLASVQVARFKQEVTHPKGHVGRSAHAARLVLNISFATGLWCIWTPYMTDEGSHPASLAMVWNE